MRLLRLSIALACLVCGACIPAGKLFAQKTAVLTTNFSDAQTQKALRLVPALSATEKGITKDKSAVSATVESTPLAVPLTNVEPFLSYALTLKFSESAVENFVVSVRTSIDGATWSEYAPIAPFGDGETTIGKVVYQLMYADKATRFVQYKVELRSGILHKTPLLTECSILLIDPAVNNQTAENIILQSRVSANKAVQAVSQIPKNTPSTITQTLNRTVARPSFISRAEWGAGAVNLADLASTAPTHLVVHHSFSPGNDVVNWIAAVRSVFTFHTQSNGWSDIGYNWLIDPQGNIYQGRAWVGDNDNTRGAHFCGFNANTMGVCMLGNLNPIIPSPAAQSALMRLLAYRASANNLDAQAQQFHGSSNRTLNIISGHRDGCATDCPGDAQYPLLPMYRERAALLLRLPQVARIFFDSLSGFFVNAEVRTTISQPASVTAYFRYRENGVAQPRWDSTTIQNVRLNANGTTNITAVVPTFISRPLSRYTFQVVINTGDTTIVGSINDIASSVHRQTFRGSFRVLQDEGNRMTAEITPLSAGMAILELVNTQGQTVSREERLLVGGVVTTLALPTQALASGMYGVRVLHNGTQATQLISVVR
jgi:hypothetical protein